MPKNYHLIHAIFNEPWLISVNNHIGYINAALQGVLDPNYAVEPSEPEPIQLSGRVSIVPIKGVLTKERGFCGEPGMEDYGNVIRGQIADQTIDAIVIKIDSPGGMVKGSYELHSIIQSSTKPIVAFIDDQACSGAYLLAAACNGGIVGNNELAEVGSIGVVGIYQDVRKANEMAGITEHIVFAKQSVDKWREHREVYEGNYEGAQERLSVVADQFISCVKSGRPGVQADQLTGNVFYAKDVVGSLIDEIGSMDVAVSRALSMVKSTKNNKTMSKTKFSTVAQALGVEGFEAADGYVSLSVEQLGTVESALHSAQESSTRSTADLATANETIASLNQSISERDARIVALEKGLGAAPAAVAPATDSTQAGAPKTEHEALVEAFESARKYC